MKENKSALNQKTDVGESKYHAEKDSVLGLSSVPTYSKKSATKNIKALVSYSTELLQTLTDLYIDSLPEKQSFLKVSFPIMNESFGKALMYSCVYFVSFQSSF